MHGNNRFAVNYNPHIGGVAASDEECLRRKNFIINIIKRKGEFCDELFTN